MPALRPNARILAREDLTDSLRVVRVAPLEGPPPDFEPGQFVQLGLPEGSAGHAGHAGHARWIRRSYSIASPPGLPHLEFCIQLVEGGAFSQLLRPLQPGARLWMDDRAHGRFTLDGVQPGEDVVALATGTGVAPFLSMLRCHERDPPWRRFALVHGVRLACELGFRGSFEERAARDPRFIYVPTVTREPEGAAWNGRRGRVQALLEPEVFAAAAGFELDPATSHVFLCGNPAMIDAVRALLIARGFRPHLRTAAGNLHYERYW